MRACYENGIWAIYSALDPRALQFKPGLLCDRELCDDILDRLDTAVGAGEGGGAWTAKASAARRRAISASIESVARLRAEPSVTRWPRNASEADAAPRAAASIALPHAEKLECLRELGGRARSRRYDVGARRAPPVLINLSENATYRIDDRCVRPALGAPRPPRRLSLEERHRVRARMADGAPQRRRGDHAGAGAGRDGALIQEAGHPAMPRPAKCRALRMGERRGAVGEGPPRPRNSRCSGEVTARMHLHSQRWTRPENFERHIWDFDTSLGDRPHWGRWRDGMGLDAAKEALFARAVDLIAPAAGTIRQGAGALRPHPSRHAPRQPSRRRRRGEGHRLRRLRLLLASLRRRDRRLLLRARAARAGADGRLGEGLSQGPRRFPPRTRRRSRPSSCSAA